MTEKKYLRPQTAVIVGKISLLLDGQTVQYLFHQAGTDGAIYAGTNYAVYYRNDNMDDWMLYNEGLPMRSECNIIRPFYKEGKLRMATYGNGIWETTFHTPSAPLAQPMVDKSESFCSRDTFYFDDYSVLNHNGASWEWTFPGASYVSNANVRNPKVVYDSPGSYDVSLSITAADGQSSSKTIADMVRISSECEVDTIPGFALKLEGNSADYAGIPALNLYSNTVTFTAWIKRDGEQNPWAGLVFSRSGNTVGGLNLGENNELRYHWNESQWWWNSGLTVPNQEWTYVALVVEPDKATLYLNGEAAVNNVAHTAEEFDGALRLGADAHSGPRRFKGLMDEVCIWNRALSQEEIRALRHLTKKPEEDSDLVAYYQFNRTDGVVTDRVGIRHADLSGSAARITSTAPLGGGKSEAMIITDGGLKIFEDANLELTFAETGIFPEGEIVVSRINLLPNIPVGEIYQSQTYWIINNYGANPDFTPPENIAFDSIGQISNEQALQPGNFRMFQRADNADDDSWTELDGADEAIGGDEGRIVFSENNMLNSSGQLFIALDSVLTSTPIELYLPQDYVLFFFFFTPGEKLQIRARHFKSYQFSLFGSDGKRLFTKSLQGSSSLEKLQLDPGIYFYLIEEDKQIFTGKIIVQNE